MNNPARAVLDSPRAGWRETTALVVAASLVPVLVHLIPWTGDRPLGVYLLPVFWTTFVAVYFYGATCGLLVGLLGPGLNLLLTGLPAVKAVGLMSLEVAFFALLASRLATLRPNFRFTAPLAYVVAKAAVIMIAFIVPVWSGAGNPFRHLMRSVRDGLTGLVVLAVINVLLVAFYSRTDAWEKE